MSLLQVYTICGESRWYLRELWEHGGILHVSTLYKYKILHSLRDDMVDCHPKETLSTEAEPRLTMLFKGWRSTMSSRKECNIYFIIPNVPISYTTLFLCYQITLRTGRHFHWMSPVAMTLLRMSRRRPLVSQFEPCAHIFAHVTFLECHPPFISPCKIVTRSIDQSY